MKILVMQLARLGDIYQTWPTLNALRRSNPSDEIHLLVRKRFSSATVGLTGVDKVIIFNNKTILSPFMLDGKTSDSLSQMEEFLSDLNTESYDKVINLSFSPVSSYITNLISKNDMEIRGYSRFSDGYLSIEDETSAYFYAQVGVEKFNQIHLVELFASVAGVELQDCDFKIKDGYSYNKNYEKLIQSSKDQGRKSIVVHIGASQKIKTFSAFKWKRVVHKLIKNSNYVVYLIGSEDEISIKNQIVSGFEAENLVDWVGKTEMGDLYKILLESDLIIGADSMVVQLASLLNKMTLNISFKSVRFWETGPLAVGSRIILGENEDTISSDQVIREANSMLSGGKSGNDVVNVISSGLKKYKHFVYEEPNFEWALIEALYLSKDLPQKLTSTTIHGIEKLIQLVLLAEEQYESMRANLKNEFSLKILEEVDGLMLAVRNYVPELSPLVDWFFTKKIMIPPSSVDEVFNSTVDIYKEFKLVLLSLLTHQEAEMEYATR